MQHRFSHSGFATLAIRAGVCGSTVLKLLSKPSLKVKGFSAVVIWRTG